MGNIFKLHQLKMLKTSQSPLSIIFQGITHSQMMALLEEQQDAVEISNQHEK